jgi:tetratricopeptide (TPR) repeat protein
MLRFSPFLVPLALFAACSSSSKSETTSEITEIALADGTVLEGRVVHTSAETVAFRVDGEEKPRTYKRTDLQPLSWYEARNASMDTDARLELARFCLENDLHEAAEIEMAKVIEMDPSQADELVAEVERARTRRAAELTKESETAFAKGESSKAERLAADVVTRFPETPSVPTAVAILDRIDATVADPGDPDSGVQLVARSSQAATQLTTATRYAERARKRHLAALRKSGSAAREDFDRAIEDFERSVRILDGLTTAQDGGVEVVQATQELATVRASLVDAYIDLGNFYLGRGSYPQAREVARDALEVDPQSARAQQFVRHADLVAEDQEALRRFSRLTGRKLR